MLCANASGVVVSTTCAANQAANSRQVIEFGVLPWQIPWKISIRNGYCGGKGGPLTLLEEVPQRPRQTELNPLR
jgi:hypothetical protein